MASEGLIASGTLFAASAVAAGILVGMTWNQVTPTWLNPDNQPNGSKDCKSCKSSTNTAANSGVVLTSFPNEDFQSIATPSFNSMMMPTEVVTSMPQEASIVVNPIPAMPQQAVQAVQAVQDFVPMQSQVVPMQSQVVQTQPQVVTGADLNVMAMLPAGYQNKQTGTNDSAGQLMEALAPNKADLMSVTTRNGSNRFAVINGRSSRSRILGPQSLLRPPAPMPNCGTSEPTFLDSELRHMALNANTPPVCLN